MTGKEYTYVLKVFLSLALSIVYTAIFFSKIYMACNMTRDRRVVETTNLIAKRIARLHGNEPDAVKAKEHYSTDVEQYKAMVAMAVESMRTR